MVVAVLSGAAAWLLKGRLSTRPATTAGSTAPPVKRGTPLNLTGQVQAAEKVTLLAPVAGKVVALGASQGLTVAGDQLLLQLDSAEARAALKAAQAKLKRVQAQIASSQGPKLLERIKQAEIQLQSAETNRRQVQTDLESLQREKPDAVQAETELEATQRAAALKTRAYQEAYQAWDAAQKRANTTGQSGAELDRRTEALKHARAENASAQVAFNDAKQTQLRLRTQIAKLERQKHTLARARTTAEHYRFVLNDMRQNPAAKAALHGDDLLQAAQGEVAAAEKKLAACAVTAPEAGRLLELLVRPGAVVKTGQALAVVEKLSGARLVCVVTPQQAQGVVVGQRGQVTPEGGQPFAVAVSQLVPRVQGGLVYLQPLGKVTLPTPGTALAVKLR